MLITDHDTYDGYRYWRDNIKDKKYKDFVVLRGIEYDTLDAGHFLVVMPTDVSLKILEHKGMPLWLLMLVVHKHNGIIGPAHPYGERFLSVFNTGIHKKTTAIATDFDLSRRTDCSWPSPSFPEAQRFCGSRRGACPRGSPAAPSRA